MSEIAVSASWRVNANAPSLIDVDTTLSKRSSEPAGGTLRAAQRALEFVKPGMTLGLGSGSAAQLWIRLLGEQVRDHGLKIKAIASSKDSELLGRSYGIPFVSFEDHELLDFTVDGADEIAPRLALIKGHGGNLLREKIVASASRRLLIVADQSRVVDTLGRSPLPVEVIPMAAPLVGRALQELGFTARVRVQNDGTHFITDEGNLILDCSGLTIEDPYAIAAEIDAIVGVVEHGIFLDMVDIALITSGSDLIERTR
jgi:ribose 5-phosphate isomerase A